RRSRRRAVLRSSCVDGRRQRDLIVRWSSARLTERSIRRYAPTAPAPVKPDRGGPDSVRAAAQRLDDQRRSAELSSSTAGAAGALIAEPLLKRSARARSLCLRSRTG